MVESAIIVGFDRDALGFDYLGREDNDPKSFLKGKRMDQIKLDGFRIQI